MLRRSCKQELWFAHKQNRAPRYQASQKPNISSHTMASQSALTRDINDFVGLPIIITDYDFDSNKSSPSTTSTQSSSSAASTVSPAEQNQITGFSEVADGLWAKMTQGMKKKLRDACIDVLKKTDDAESRRIEEGLDWQYDDDARFLD